MSDYEDVNLDEQEVDVAEDATPDMSYDKKGEEGKALAATDKAAKNLASPHLLARETKRTAKQCPSLRLAL